MSFRRSKNSCYNFWGENMYDSMQLKFLKILKIMHLINVTKRRYLVDLYVTKLPRWISAGKNTVLLDSLLMTLSKSTGKVSNFWFCKESLKILFAIDWKAQAMWWTYFLRFKKILRWLKKTFFFKGEFNLPLNPKTWNQKFKDFIKMNYK